MLSKSKHPEDAYCYVAASGSSLEEPVLVSPSCSFVSFVVKLFISSHQN
jgi:hypothetical protein